MKTLLILAIIALSIIITGCGSSLQPKDGDTHTAIITFKGRNYTKVRDIKSNKSITLEDTFTESIGDTIKWIDMEWDTERDITR